MKNKNIYKVKQEEGEENEIPVNPPQKYTLKFYNSIIVALLSVFITGFHLNLFNSLHTFLKCFFFVNLKENEDLIYRVVLDLTLKLRKS